jgi:hypothetical protein
MDYCDGDCSCGDKTVMIVMVMTAQLEAHLLLMTSEQL